MGVRLYNATTGRFLSVDPIPGGNPNAYTYPTDPINDYDLDGRASWRGFKKHMRKNWRTYALLGICVFGAGALCLGLSAAAATYDYVSRGRKTNKWGGKNLRRFGVDMAFVGVGSGAAAGFAKITSGAGRKFLGSPRMRFSRHRAGGASHRAGKSRTNWQRTRLNYNTNALSFVYGNGFGYR